MKRRIPLIFVLGAIGLFSAGCPSSEPAAAPSPVVENPNAVANPEAGKAAPKEMSVPQRDLIEGKG
jgi:hypothetical protein